MWYLIWMLILILIYLMSRTRAIDVLPRGTYLVVGNCTSCLPSHAQLLLSTFDGTVVFFNYNDRYLHLCKNFIHVTNLEMYLTNWRKKTLPNTYVLLTHPWCMAFSRLFRSDNVRFLYQNAMYPLQGRQCKYSSGFLVISDLVNHGSDVYYMGFDSNDQSVTGVMDTRSHNFRYERMQLAELNAKRVT